MKNQMFAGLALGGAVVATLFETGTISGQPSTSLNESDSPHHLTSIVRPTDLAVPVRRKIEPKQNTIVPAVPNVLASATETLPSGISRLQEKDGSLERLLTISNHDSISILRSFVTANLSLQEKKETMVFLSSHTFRDEELASELRMELEIISSQGEIEDRENLLLFTTNAYIRCSSDGGRVRNELENLMQQERDPMFQKLVQSIYRIHFPEDDPPRTET